MTIGQRIQKQRKEKNISLAELSLLMGVSKQDLTNWESDLETPSTEMVVKLADLLGVTCDYLLKENEVKPSIKNFRYPNRRYEYKSKKTLFGLPLIHINIGTGFHVAKGIIAIGMVAKGFLSLGLISLGLLSFGLVSLGLLAIGCLSIGGLALGSVAIGVIGIGAIAIGFFSLGALSIGYFSYGAFSIAKYVAIGDHAIGAIAIGQEYASGSIYTSFSGVQGTFVYNKDEVLRLIDGNVPHFWSIFINWIKALL